MLKIEDAGMTKRQVINKIQEELEKICSTIGQGEFEEDQSIMKNLDEFLVFLKGGPTPPGRFCTPPGCPKTKVSGRAKLVIAVSETVCHFNTGAGFHTTFNGGIRCRAEL